MCNFATQGITDQYSDGKAAKVWQLYIGLYLAFYQKHIIIYILYIYKYLPRTYLFIYI